MSFCALEEAFTGPVMPPPSVMGKQAKRTKKLREMFTPGSLPAAPDPDRPTAPPPPANDIMTGPPTDKVPTEGPGVKLDSLFPLPGETGEVESWEKAFTLDGSQLQVPAPTRPDGSAAVSGQPTLWRQIVTRNGGAPGSLAAVPTRAVESLAGVPSEINQRLEALTRQLESLTAPAPLQSTAELFLFVAIGLLILLAIDTLLRFSVSLVEKRMGQSGGVRLRGPGGRFIR